MRVVRFDRLVVVGIILWGIAALAPLGAAVWRTHTDPGIPFLLDVSGAAWVVVDREFHPNPRREADAAFFVRPFELQDAREVRLTVHALGTWTVHLDGAVVQHGPADAWREGVDVSLGTLSSGPHELAVEVRHARGPAAIAVVGAGLSTPAGWRATVDGERLVAVRDVADRRLAPVAMAFPSTLEAVYDRAPTIVLVVLCVVLMHGISRRWSRPPLPDRVVLGVGVLIVGVWTAGSLGLHAVLGFDAPAHHAYLAFLLDKRSLPTANDGWQMFQPPLYYVLAAPLFAMGRFPGGDWPVVLARLVSLGCGLGLTALIWQTLSTTTSTSWARRRAFMVMACLPMALTMYRFNGNEPLAAVLTAGVTWMALSMSGREPPTPQKFLGLGVLAGLAVLAKVSALVVAPAVAVTLLHDTGGQHRTIRARLVGPGLVSLAFVVTCGWWFARNVVRLGTPFVGGWDPARTVAWWQDPGFRTSEDFTTFGISLWRPVFSAVASVWDGLYASFWCDGYLSGRASVDASPPWDWTSLIASVPFSVPLSAMIVWGAVDAIRARDRAGIFATACLVSWLVAIVSLTMTLPIFSTAKASYMLGILPCVAILLARGLDAIQTAALKHIVETVIAVWLVLTLRGLW